MMKDKTDVEDTEDIEIEYPKDYNKWPLHQKLRWVRKKEEELGQKIPYSANKCISCHGLG